MSQFASVLLRESSPEPNLVDANAKPDPETDLTLLPPFVPIQGLDNFRDVGGYAIATPSYTCSSLTRKFILYRGPDISPIAVAGVRKLHTLNIKMIFDIRSVPQITRAGGVKEIEGIERVWCPVFSEEEYTEAKAGARYGMYCEDGCNGIVKAFEEILIHGAKGGAFKIILLHFASLADEEKPSATLIHCTTGNNRSGVFIGILLSLLGVPPQTVACEYALSQLGLAKGRGSVIQRLLKNQGFRTALGDINIEEAKRKAERMVGAREESMLAMLEMVGRKWGSGEADWRGGVEGYIRNVVGLSDWEIERVRKALTE
ncbi:hypothetical protein B7494_g4955 [Chlorociboria aeruginascens]|nr:hypothetical protein B7494_g4955 [Chlorociboria aeruginascens]